MLGSKRYRSAFQSCIEPLENRVLLAANLLITEFMASNGNTLIDSRDETPDWIEIYNDGDMIADLADGYYLTDDPQDLTKWGFPDVPETELGFKQYLVVMASGADTQDDDGTLHTNFRLSRNGDYLALVYVDGQSTRIVSQFGSANSAYSDQRGDISYGLSFENRLLVGSGSAVDVLVPSTADDARLGDSWKGGNEVALAASGGLDGWQRGTSGVGFHSDTIAPYRELVMSESSLLSFYTFENDSGGPKGVQDVAPQRPRHGTLEGSAGFGPGVDGDGGKSLTLDGSGFVSLGAVPEFLFRDGEATIEAWLRPTFSPQSSPVAWYGTRNEPRRGPFTEYHSTWVHGDYSGLSSTSDAGVGQIADFDIPRNEWFHVAVVYADGLTRIYMNGVLIDDFGLGTFSAPDGRASTHIGTTGFALDRDAFIGQIDEVAIYNAPLDEPTIRSHYEHLVFSRDGVRLGTDLGAEMLGGNASSYVRTEFTIDDPKLVSSLTLRMRHSDGFVAYLNGHRIAQRNAPETLDFQSTATDVHSLADVQEFDLRTYVGALRAGDNVLAIHGLNASGDDEGFIIDPELIAHHIDRDSALYLLEPTPGGPNANGVSGFVQQPTMSVPRGIHDHAFDVTISGITPGAFLVYTTDGSEPTAANGVVIAAESDAVPARVTLPVSDAFTVLRARGFQEQLGASAVETRTYILLRDLDDVSELGGFRLSKIHPRNRDGLIDNMKALPTIALSMDEDEIFGYGGIYAASLHSGRNAEVPVSFEIFDATTGDEMQVDGGLRISGAGARHFEKKPFRFFLRGAYGSQQLQYPLFNQTDISPVDTFTTIKLKAGGHDQPAAGGTYRNDAFFRQTQRDMGNVSARSSWAHLYINGKYWGVYMPTEQPRSDFAADHIGGIPEDWTIVHAEPDRTLRVIEGDPDPWVTIKDIVVAGPPDDAAWRRIQDLVDYDNFIDEIMIRIYAGIGDWWGWNNLYAIRHPDFDGFKFLTWDAEITMSGNPQGDADLSRITPAPGTPGGIFWWSMDHPEFRLKFADRIHKHFFNDGEMTPTRMHARWDHFDNLLSGPLVLEIARWGGGSQKSVRKWLTERTDYMFEQFKERGLYPDIGAPQYLVNDVPQHGGRVARDDLVSITSTLGTTSYYTTDGSDPRLEGGAVNPKAKLLNADEFLTIRRDEMIKARALADGEWSALSEANFTLPAASANLTNLRISEVHFNPAAPTPEETAMGYDNNDDFEFVELVNIDGQQIDLSSLRLVRQMVGEINEGVDFDFSRGSIKTLGPGERVVVVENSDAFRFRYGDGLTVTGQWTGGLGNGGEQITLMADDQVIHQFAYDDGWHQATDGGGPSLEIIDASHANRFVWGQQMGWRESAQRGGTPGQASPAGNFDPDAAVDADDIDLLYDHIHSQVNHPVFDLTRDGSVNKADVDELVLNLLQTRFGDSDLDGKVDQVDFETFASNFGTEGGWRGGDFDGDGIISFADFTILANNYGR